MQDNVDFIVKILNNIPTEKCDSLLLHTPINFISANCNSKIGVALSIVDIRRHKHHFFTSVMAVVLFTIIRDEGENITKIAEYLVYGFNGETRTTFLCKLKEVLKHYQAVHLMNLPIDTTNFKINGESLIKEASVEF